MAAFLALDGFVGISVAALALAQASQVSRNVTTNELANWHRCVSCSLCPEHRLTHIHTYRRHLACTHTHRSASRAEMLVW